jgi:hypothetical protein
MTYSPVGFAYDADVHCVECSQDRFGVAPWPDLIPTGVEDSEGNEPSAIFEDSESDVPEHCSDCRAFLGTNLTSDGYAYVVAALRDVADGTPDVLSEWFDAYSAWFSAEDWEELARAWFPKVIGPRYTLAELRNGTGFAPNARFTQEGSDA